MIRADAARYRILIERKFFCFHLFSLCYRKIVDKKANIVVAPFCFDNYNYNIVSNICQAKLGGKHERKRDDI
jgi:hypothetical protein